MAKKIIMANWKMNLSNKKAISFVQHFKNPSRDKAKVVIAAPYTFLPALSMLKTDIAFAGENVSAVDSGAYTGEISAAMLKELGVKYCLVGHSERRIYFHEDNKHINQKTHQLIGKGIRPVLCFGETAVERKAGKTKSVIRRQLREGLKNIKNLSTIVLAYEPVWAISTFQTGKLKKSATENDILESHLYIKKVMNDLFGKKADGIPLLYGGSVNFKNSKTFINFEVVDGVLVGGASLKTSSFEAIIKNIK